MRENKERVFLTLKVSKADRTARSLLERSQLPAAMGRAVTAVRPLYVSITRFCDEYHRLEGGLP